MRRHPVLLDVVLVLTAFLLAAVAVGVIWPQVVDPVVVTRTNNGLLTGEVALAQRFDRVGWYSMLGGGAGLVLGALLLLLLRTHEVVTVLAVLGGAFLAAWLSAQVGTSLGPDDPNRVLADAAVGTKAPDRITLGADAAYLVWPIAAMLGAVVVQFTRPHAPEE